jgi:Domain of unknown function (DUF4157)
MFAPPVKAPKAKTASHTVPTRAPKSPQNIFGRPGLGRAERMLTLQRTIGNQAVLRLLAQEADLARIAGPEAVPSLARDVSKIPVFPPDRASRPQTSSPLIQPKLAIGEVNDPLEHEADRVANRVMSMSGRQVQHTCACGGECPKCKEEQSHHRSLQITPIRRADASSTTIPAEFAISEAPDFVHEVLHSSGQPLDELTRTFMGRQFGHDFSRVRVHTDEKATRAASALQAHAFTLGRDIFFGQGEFAPFSQNGRRLLAHELTHVVQQRSTLAHANHKSLTIQRTPKDWAPRRPPKDWAPQGPTPKGPTPLTDDCSGWERDLQSFTKIIAEHFAATELGVTAKGNIDLDWLDTNQMTCHVDFPGDIHVLVGIRSDQRYVIAVQFLTSGPRRLGLRREYRYSCPPGKKPTFSPR